MRQRSTLQRLTLYGLGLLVASLCSLTALSHTQNETHASAAQNCLAACHSHGQAVVGDNASLRQQEENNHDPTPPPYAYWLQFATPLYLLPLVIPVLIIYRPKTPMFLVQQRLRF
jgi:hypothetical protein